MEVSEIARVPCFLAVRRDRPALREQVETALVRITEVLRDCDRDGNERHFIVHEDAGSIFSPDDLSWIKRRKAAARPVRVDISPLLPPLKAWNAERSEPEGFIRALFDEFSRQTSRMPRLRVSLKKSD